MAATPQRLMWDRNLQTHRVEDEQKPGGQQLYHVGCGHRLVTREQVERGMMAIACRCGANGPIVVTDLEDPNPSCDVLPASLVNAALRKRTPPHLEYYLGLSDFTCPAKQAWERRLREQGSISFRECTESGCRETWERSKARRERK